MPKDEHIGLTMFAPSRRQVMQAGALTVGASLIGGMSGVATADDIDPTGAGADGRPAPGGAPSRAAAVSAAAPGSSTSYNGWPVGSPGSTIGVQNYVIPGTSVVVPLRSGDVATVLLYVAQRFNAEVEALQGGQCWGYSYRANVNNPSVWSNHASGTAIDFNSAVHPNGARYTFNEAQVAAVRRILAFCGEVVYWGQDYTGTVDGMHFEIDVPPGDLSLTNLVNKIRAGATWAPGVASYVDRSGNYHLFSVSGSGGLTELVYTGGATWTRKDASSGGYVVGKPAVVYGNDRVDVFAIGGDTAIWQQSRTGSGGWSGWRRLGAAGMVSGVEAIIDPNGAFHVFCVSQAGGLYQVMGSGSSWSLQDITNGGRVRGVPAATYRNGVYDIYAIGMDGAAWQQSWIEGRGWVAWHQIGGVILGGGLDAVIDNGGVNRVFGTTANSHLLQLAYYGGSAWSMQDVTNGGSVHGVPSVVVTGNRYDLFALGSDDAAWQQTSVGGTPWSQWQRLGGSFP